MNEEQTYTVEQKLRGKFSTLLTDANIMSVCDDAGIDANGDWKSLSEKQKDMALAWTYVLLSDKETTSQKISDKDGDWSHSEGGTTISKEDKKNWLRKANALFAKWGMPLINPDKWGMICGGFHDIRSYNGKRRRA